MHLLATAIVAATLAGHAAASRPGYPHPIAGAAAGRAQDPAAAPERPTGTALGLARSSSGRPVADAVVTWLSRPTDRPAWLPSVSPPAPALGRTDARGRFRFAVPPGPATCLVTTADGIGTLVADAAADVPLPVTLGPLAAVRFADGRRFTGRLRAVLGPGRTIELPRFETDELRLPAGPWIAWIETDDRAFEWSRDLLEGEEATIVPPPDPAPVLSTARPVLSVGSGRWPPDPDRRELRLARLSAPDSLLAWCGTEDAAVLAEGWIAGGDVRRVALAAPEFDFVPTRLELRGFSGALRPDRVVAWTVVARPAGPRAVARGVTAPRPAADAPWTVPVAIPPERDATIVVRATGAASRAIRAAELADAIVLVPAAQLTGSIVGPDGDAVAGATVHVRRRDPLLDANVTTDARGRFAVGDLDPAESVGLLIDHPAHPPRELRLAAGAVEAGEIALAAGAELLGVARDADGAPLAGVAVELRDASGVSELAARRTVTDADGRFRFRGLPVGQTFVVFGSTERGGHTWSGKLAAAWPGADEWTLTVRDEDPTAPERRRDRRQ